LAVVPNTVELFWSSI